MKTLFGYHIGVTSASRSESSDRNVTAEKVTKIVSVTQRRLYVKAISTTFYECTKSS